MLPKLITTSLTSCFLGSLMGHYGSKLLETFDIFHYEEEEVKILPSHQLPSNSLGKILDNIEVLTMESDGDLTLSASINLQKWERTFVLI